jgi:PAS domain-containing protein
MMDKAGPIPVCLEAEIATLRQRVAALEAAEHMAQEARRYAEQVVDTVREALLLMDGDLRIVAANRAFYQLFNVTPAETEHRFLYELGNQQWNIPRLRLLLEDLLPTHTSFDNFEVAHTFPHLGRRTMCLNARRFALEGADTMQILLALEDIHRGKEAEAALQAQRDWFDGTLSSIGDGVIATDVHGTVIFLDPVAEVLTGWSKTEAQGRPLSEVFHILNEQTRQPVADDPVCRVLEGCALGLANHTLLLIRFGGEIPIADSAAPIRDRHGCSMAW